MVSIKSIKWLRLLRMEVLALRVVRVDRWYCLRGWPLVL